MWVADGILKACHRFIQSWKKQFACWQLTFYDPMASSPAHRISVFSISKQSPPSQMPRQPIQDKYRLSVGVILSMATYTKYKIVDPSPMLIDHIFAAKHWAHPQNPIFCIYLNDFTRIAWKMQRFSVKSIASLSLLRWSVFYLWWINMLRMSEYNWRECYGL